MGECGWNVWNVSKHTSNFQKDCQIQGHLKEEKNRGEGHKGKAGLQDERPTWFASCIATHCVAWEVSGVVDSAATSTLGFEKFD